MKSSHYSVAMLAVVLTTSIMSNCSDIQAPIPAVDNQTDQGSDSTTEDTFLAWQGTDAAREDTAADAMSDSLDFDSPPGPAPGELGGACSTSADCMWNACIPDEKSMTCAANTGLGVCWASAGALRVINKAWSRSDPWWLCVSLAALEGVPCTSDDDCYFETAEFVLKDSNSWRCRDVASGTGWVTVRQCVARCGLVPKCTTCDGGEDGGCVPADIIPCPYYGATSKGSGPCARANEFGTCSGASVCSTIGEAPMCNAPEPTTEACAPSGKGDSIDQDCDGQTDEGCAP